MGAESLIETLRRSRIACRTLNECAFTMIELLAVIGIFGLLAAFAFPGFKALASSYDRQNAEATFEFDLRRARAEALSRGCRIIMTIAGDGKSYTVGEDRLPYDTATAVPDTIIYTTRLPNSTSVVLGSGNKILFNSRGFLSDTSGIPRTTTVAVTLSSNGSTFATATLYPIGVAKFIG